MEKQKFNDELQNNAERYLGKTMDEVLSFYDRYAGYVDGVMQQAKNPTTDYVWALYNFVNEYKDGAFGIVSLEDAIKSNFEKFLFSNVDSKK